MYFYAWIFQPESAVPSLVWVQAGGRRQQQRRERPEKPNVANQGAVHGHRVPNVDLQRSYTHWAWS
jgi:hypothetical protein